MLDYILAFFGLQRCMRAPDPGVVMVSYAQQFLLISGNSEDPRVAEKMFKEMQQVCRDNNFYMEEIKVIEEIDGACARYVRRK